MRLRKEIEGKYGQQYNRQYFDLLNMSELSMNRVDTKEKWVETVLLLYIISLDGAARLDKGKQATVKLPFQRPVHREEVP